MKARSGAEMSRSLHWWDVIALGVGGMVGAGIFVSTGTAAHQYAGPSVVIAYLIAGISALLSALCYTEFAVEMPVAGGAFSYLRITFGTFTTRFFYTLGSFSFLRSATSDHSFVWIFSLLSRRSPRFHSPWKSSVFLARGWFCWTASENFVDLLQGNLLLS